MHTVDLLNAALPRAARLLSFTTRHPERSDCEPLPERLRRAVEWLSGYDLSDVRVHAASGWPARVGARAFVLGRDIFLSPGAEDALPHEAWHVVQQKQARVRATGLVRFEEAGPGVGLNDDDELEREAEVMGRVARSLALGAEALPVRRPARFASIQRPVVQRALTVGQQTYTWLQHAALLEEVHQQLMLARDMVNKPNMIAKPNMLAEIVNDLCAEGLTFDAWPAVLREICIREVGYLAEESMRDLLEDHSGRYALACDSAKAQLEVANASWTYDQKMPYFQRKKFKTKEEWKQECENIDADLMDGIIEWCNASYFTSYDRATWERPMFQWITGQTQEPPLKMNCWEGVLYALYRTGLVDETYIGWCNSNGNPSRFPGHEKTTTGTTFPLLVQQCILNMDYYWGDWDPAFGANPNNANRRRESRVGFQPGQGAIEPRFCVPTQTIIPRGRLLVFSKGEHVAISTGRLIPIQSVRARRYFGTHQGHGMIELDGVYSAGATDRTFREGTIEDLFHDKSFYLKNLIVAPFPICAEGGELVLRGTASENPSEAAKMAADIEEAKKAYLERDKIKEQIKKDREKLERDLARCKKALEQYQGPLPDNEDKRQQYNVAETRYTNTEKELNGLDKRWDARAADAVKMTMQRARREETARSKSKKKPSPPKIELRFKYNKNDPYKGRVRF